MGGHFVTGHIDVVGEVRFSKKGENLYFRVALPQYSKYLVDKGCVSSMDVH